MDTQFIGRTFRVVSSRTVRLIFAGIIFLPWVVAAPAVTTPAPVGYDWLQFGGDPQHSGVNSLETLISPSNVSSLHQAFQVHLPGIADGAPAYFRFDSHFKWHPQPAIPHHHRRPHPGVGCENRGASVGAAGGSGGLPSKQWDRRLLYYLLTGRRSEPPVRLQLWPGWESA